ncbi:MAG: SRPBCC family protein, partial [Planctomycetota bacterium]
WVILRETIACHHEEVFACLTTAAGLSRWFPVAAKVDLKPGGEIVLGWNEDFSRKTTIEIIDYHADGRIVWNWYAAQYEFRAPVHWEVEPNVEEGCKVRLRQGPFADDMESLLAMANEAESWRWQLCNLRSVLEASVDMRKHRPL